MLVDKPALLELLLRRLDDAQTIAVDVETSGLDWKKNHIVGWVLTVGPKPDDTFYVPVRHAGGGNLPGASVPMDATGWDGTAHPAEKQIIYKLSGKELVFHNGAFDMKFMHRVGWWPSGPTRDTMIGAYIIDELRRSLSLDACCKDFGVQPKLGEELYAYMAKEFGGEANRDQMSSYWRTNASVPVVWDYAAGDGTSTYQLWLEERKQLLRSYYTNGNREYNLIQVSGIEFDLMPVLHRMSTRGVRIDEEALERLTSEFTEEFEKATAALGGINVRAPSQMVKYFTDHGITDWPTSPTGRPSFPEQWLLTNEPGQAVVKARKYGNLLSSFLLPMKEHLWNGRVHTDFHQTRDEEYGTRTGRMSTTGPNLGAMPGKRQGALGKKFRTIFIPDDGMEFTEGDYNVCEIRICAHYCQAQAWIDGFKRGTDAHTAVAEAIWPPELVKENRRFAKAINLAIMTGAGKKKIASQLGLTQREGEAIVDEYFGKLPELKRFQAKSSAIFESRGFVSTLGGRRLHLADRQKAYTAVNRLTQGGNADIVKSAMVEMDKHADTELLLTVYDSALIQHEKGNYGAAINTLETMANMEKLNIPFTVPMKVDYGHGPDWGEAAFSEVGSIEWKPEDW